MSLTQGARSGCRERRLYGGACSAISRSSRTRASSGVAQTTGVTVVARRTISPDPPALLRRGEVAADAGPDVAGHADVEHPRVLVPEDVDAGCVRQVVGEVPLPAGLLRHPGCELAQLFQGGDAQPADPCDQPVQDVDGGPRVDQRPVVGRGRGVEMPGEGGQPVVHHLVAADHVPGQVCGVQDHRPRPPVAGSAAGRLEEGDVERRVVGHQDAAAGELEEGRQHRLERGSAGHHDVGDAGQHRDERRDRRSRVDQGLELPEHLAAAYLDRPDLGDPGVGRGAAGGLQVDDDERDLEQRRAQLVQRGLHGAGAGVPQRDGSGCRDHACDHKERGRQPRPTRGTDPPAGRVPGCRGWSGPGRRLDGDARRVPSGPGREGTA